MQNRFAFLDRAVITLIAALVVSEFALLGVAATSAWLLTKCLIVSFVAAIVVALAGLGIKRTLSIAQRQVAILVVVALIASSTFTAMARAFDSTKSAAHAKRLQDRATATQRSTANARERERSATQASIASAAAATQKQLGDCVAAGGPQARACAEQGRAIQQWIETQDEEGFPAVPSADTLTPPTTSDTPPGAEAKPIEPTPPIGKEEPTPKPIEGPRLDSELPPSPLQLLLEAFALPFGPLLRALLSFGSSDEYHQAVRALARELASGQAPSKGSIDSVLATADDTRGALSALGRLSRSLPAEQQIGMRSSMAAASVALLQSKYLEEIIRRLNAGVPPESLIDVLPDRKFASSEQKRLFRDVLLATGREQIWRSVFEGVPTK